MPIICSEEKATLCWLEASDRITDPAPLSDKLSAVLALEERKSRILALSEEAGSSSSPSTFYLLLSTLIASWAARNLCI